MNDQMNAGDLFAVQAKTITVVTDALFNPKPRKQNEYEMLDKAIVLAIRLDALLEKLVLMFSDKRSNLEEAANFVEDCRVNLIAHLRDVRDGVE